MVKKFLVTVLAFLLFLGSVRSVQAVGLQVEPVRQEVTTTADKATQLRFQLTNPEAAPVQVKVEVKDVASLSDKGVPSFKDTAESDSAKWVKPVASLEIPAHGTLVVPVEIQLPSNAPKSLFFGVFFTALPIAEQKSPVGIQTSIGGLVALTRSDVPDKAELVFKEVSWNAQQDTLQLKMAAENIGNIHLKVEGQAWLEPGLGNRQSATAKVALNPLGRWVLPEDQLLIELPKVQENKWIPQLWWFTADFHLNGVQQHKRIPLVRLTDQIMITIVLFFSILMLIGLAIIFGLYRFSQRRTPPSHS